jgi:hypothetical protein
VRPGRALAGALLASAVAAAVPVLAEPADRAGGYAFDHPRLLAEQLIWGRLHGIRLLAQACQDRGAVPAALAYADWLDRQWPRIRRTQRGLARHYFGQEAATLGALDRALGLQPELAAMPAEELAVACATLPAALAEPRNDLEHIYNERRESIRRGSPEFPGAVWQEQE